MYMKRKCISLLLITALTASLFTGCGSKATSSSGEELNIYVWTEYVPQSVIDKLQKKP